MTRKARILLQNFCYHVIVRGNQQQFTFLDDEDFHKVLKFLKKYKLKFKMEIYAYCIMGNHMHLLLNPSKSDILKKFMHGINMSYAKHFNYKYKKCGHVWHDRFKSYIITKDSYIFNCVNYIEYNPIRAKIVDKPEDYEWSSYRGRHGITKDSLFDEITI